MSKEKFGPCEEKNCSWCCDPVKVPQGFIDDSYNISKNSAEAALEFLKEAFPKKEKLLLLPDWLSKERKIKKITYGSEKK